MEERYDVIILGTGLAESCLAALLAVQGKSVLQLDKNDFYGGESASISLEQLYALHGRGAPPPTLGKSRDWNIDLIPKFLMASETMTRLLVHTDIAKYLTFKQLTGSFVVDAGQVAKVPATEREALTSGLLGTFEKFRVRGFYEFMGQFDPLEPTTYRGVQPTMTALSLFDKFSLSPATRRVIGHALCLFPDDVYLQRPMIELHAAMVRYVRSLGTYGISPYIYPQFGLGELSQAFARKAAVHGATTMLRAEISGLVFEDGRIAGVRLGSPSGVVRSDVVIGAAAYLPEFCRKVGKIERSIFLVRSVPDGMTDACQVILPGSTSDAYLAILGPGLSVCPTGYALCVASTAADEGLNSVQKILSPVVEPFVSKSDALAPLAVLPTGLFVLPSMDSSSHFQSTTDVILSTYRAVTGRAVNLDGWIIR